MWWLWCFFFFIQIEKDKHNPSECVAYTRDEVANKHHSTTAANVAICNVSGVVLLGAEAPQRQLGAVGRSGSMPSMGPDASRARRSASFKLVPYSSRLGRTRIR